MKLVSRITNTVTETERVAEDLALSLLAGDTVALSGQVGSGKTSFVRGLARGLQCEIMAKSPSYTIVNEYPGPVPLYHLDFYRLFTDAEIEDLGWRDYLESDGIVVIEWAERVKNILPTITVDVYFQILGENSRRLEIFVDDNFGNRKLG